MKGRMSSMPERGQYAHKPDFVVAELLSGFYRENGRAGTPLPADSKQEQWRARSDAPYRPFHCAAENEVHANSLLHALPNPALLFPPLRKSRHPAVGEIRRESFFSPLKRLKTKW